MKRQAGFTWLEMLAALTLMAICSTVLLVAFGQSARSLLQVSHSDRLTHAALSVMDQEGTGPLASGIRQGDELHKASGASASEFTSALTMLEINGSIVGLGANQWRLK